jgi:hypothetical protein
VSFVLGKKLWPKYPNWFFVVTPCFLVRSGTRTGHVTGLKLKLLFPRQQLRYDGDVLFVHPVITELLTR